MSGDKKQIKLEPTAALVMELSRPVFEASDLTKKYISNLDLSSGRDLIEHYKTHGVFALATEVLSNRKYAVRQILFDLLEKAKSPHQVLIIAAGKSPVGMEAVVEKAPKIKRVFELDISSLADKATLYHKLVPQTREMVSFVEADLLGDDLFPKLEAAGFDAKAPTIILFEGISHYLSKEKCAEILKRFISPDHSRPIIFEFCLKYETLVNWIRPIAQEAFRAITIRYFPTDTVRYSILEISEIFRILGGKLVHHYRQSEMELMRLGKNVKFKENNSGWVEIALGQI